MVIHPLQLLQSTSDIASSEATITKNTTKSCKSIRLQGTRKIGCPAHIHIHKLHLYPNFKVSPNVAASFGSRKLKEMRAKRLGELTEVLVKGSKLELKTK